MVTNKTEANCLNTLKELASRYPAQQRWGELAAQIEAELTGGGPPAPVGDEPGPKPQPSGNCQCCERRPNATEHGLCEFCKRLYTAHTARVVEGQCDCGHEPREPVVFVYQPDRRGTTFCSAKCVARHWKETFAFFIRRSTCRP